MTRPSGILERFVRFLGVGALGFLIDAGVFALALEVALLGPAAARLVAFCAAAAFTWILNRQFTFGDRASAQKVREFGRYALASLTAGAANLMTYGTVIHLFGAERPMPYLALVAGVGVGLAINFLLYSVLVFRPIR